MANKKQLEYTEDGDPQSKKVLKSIAEGSSPEAARYIDSDQFKKDKKSGNKEYRYRKKLTKDFRKRKPGQVTGRLK